MPPRSQEVKPAGFWSLNADMLALVETFVEPTALPALALADQRCRDAARPRLQALATLRLVPFHLRGEQILSMVYDLFNRRFGAAGAQTLATIVAPILGGQLWKATVEIHLAWLCFVVLGGTEVLVSFLTFVQTPLPAVREEEEVAVTAASVSGPLE